jgi:hypothetical protein
MPVGEDHDVNIVRTDPEFVQACKERAVGHPEAGIEQDPG